MNYKSITLLYLLLFPLFALAQLNDQAQGDFNVIKDKIEDILSNQEESQAYEDNSIFDILETHFNNPMNINKVTTEQLQELRFLSDVQVQQIVNHRAKYGDYIALYELQSIPSLDEETIQLLLPFIRISGNVDDYNMPLGQMLYKGKNTIYARMDRTLEEQKGFKSIDDDAPAYLGERNRYLFRFRHQYENRLSYGFTLENDAGEELFKGSNSGFPGFDFMSAHFFMKDYNSWLKDVAVGDFAVNMGQGLIQFDGFGGGKGAYTMDIKKLGRSLRPYTSASEVFYKRGLGITLAPLKNVEFMVYGSYRKRDANISDADFDYDFGELVGISNIREVSSIQLSGLHRTNNEIQDKNAIDHLNAGTTVKYKGSNWHVAANATLDQLSTPLERSPKPYNQFYFSGDALKNASIDYSFILKNFNFFGETAMSDNGGLATLNGVIAGLDRHVSVSLLHRYYQKEYQALFSNSFAETANTNNENGLYLGLELKPNKHWSFHGYFDLFNHPWMRSSADAPSKGKEYLGRLAYKIKRKFLVYAQFKDEFKEKNVPASEQTTNYDYLVTTRKSTARLHLEKNVSKALTLRSRAEMTWYNNGVNNTSRGFMVLQDVLYKPIGFPLSFTTRFAYFNIPTSDNRIYAYENDILGSFSIPGYNNKGFRYYINLRYQGIRNLSLELRYAISKYSDLETVSSGNDEIEGNQRSEIKAQVKYSF